MAARLYPGTTNGPICVDCASIERLRIDPVPDHLAGSTALAIHPYTTVYSHQAVALDPLNEGHNAVVSTPTSSGKTLIFMRHVFHVTGAGPQATALVFYPARAWQTTSSPVAEAALAAGMDPDSVEQTTGDTPMRHREQLLQRATVALVTPDMVHAWLIRTARGPAQRRSPANLRVAVTGEVLVHEDVLGTNAAFMFRRL